MPTKVLVGANAKGAVLGKGGIRFEPTANPKPIRDTRQIVVHSGITTRNRDWETNKPIRLDPMGIRIDAWNKNPIVCYDHTPEIMIGRSRMYKQNGMLMADGIEFHCQEITVPITGFLGMTGIEEFKTAWIANLWKESYLSAVSVHVILSPEDEANIIEYPDHIFIPTSEAIEFSVVPIGADGDAVRQAIKYGMPSELAFSMFQKRGQSMTTQKKEKVKSGVQSEAEEVDVELAVAEEVDEYAVGEDEEVPMAITEEMALELGKFCASDPALRAAFIQGLMTPEFVQEMSHSLGVFSEAAPIKPQTFVVKFVGPSATSQPPKPAPTPPVKLSTPVRKPQASVPTTAVTQGYEAPQGDRIARMYRPTKKSS